MTTYVYAGAADWGGKDPAKCNRGLYRLSTDTGTWTVLEKGLPEQVEVRCIRYIPSSPGRVRRHAGGSLSQHGCRQHVGAYELSER